MPITPRQHLDFDLAGDIPRHWFGGNPFRTRFFDAHSLLTPGGEKFFIDCVREFREEITDPHLLDEVNDFIKQEAQHSLQHGRSNKRMDLQGINATEIEGDHLRKMERQRRFLPRRFALALTAANEHLTTMIAHAVLMDGGLFDGADPRIFALYVWHCAEELEHKAVSFDVMQKAAKVGYPMRIISMIWATISMHAQFVSTVNRLLRADGFGRRQRLAQWYGGLRWLYGPKGPVMAQSGHYFAYFKPRFHPAQLTPAPGYGRWLDAFRRSGDPIGAAATLRGA